MDKSGTINYTGKDHLIKYNFILEFLAATIDAQIYLREENLRNAFMMFDQDESGRIDAKEVRQLLQGEDYKDDIDMNQVDKIIKEVDVNGDGEIDFEEFLAMMRNIVS